MLKVDVLTIFPEFFREVFDFGIIRRAKLAGVDEVYRIGGAQAIAALAYGTESIAPVGLCGVLTTISFVSSSPAEDCFAREPTEPVSMISPSALR